MHFSHIIQVSVQFILVKEGKPFVWLYHLVRHIVFYRARWDYSLLALTSATNIPISLPNRLDVLLRSKRSHDSDRSCAVPIGSSERDACNDQPNVEGVCILQTTSLQSKAGKYMYSTSRALAVISRRPYSTRIPSQLHQGKARQKAKLGK